MPQPGFAFFAPLRLGVRLWKAVMTGNEIAKEIVDAAFRIHTTLGPGLLESVYDAVWRMNSAAEDSASPASSQSR